MSTKSRIFQQFVNADQARVVTELLDKAGIPNQLVAERPMTDEIYTGANFEPGLKLYLFPEDFVKAHAALESHYSSMLADVEEDHYLFGFTNAELVDIIAKPDEWNTFDYLLAKKLLLEKNAGVDEHTIERLKNARREELLRPEGTPWIMLIIGYFFLLLGALGYVIILMGRFSPTFLLMILSSFLGMHLYRSSKTLPDGTTVGVFREDIRKHGRIIYYGSIILLILSSISFILWVGKTYGD